MMKIKRKKDKLKLKFSSIFRCQPIYKFIIYKNRSHRKEVYLSN